MSETIIIVPVNNDPRPTSFNYAFMRDGVRVDMTVNTREEAIAKSVRDELTTKTGWTETATNSPLEPGYVPLIVVGLFIGLGVVLFILGMLLDMAGWLPHQGGDYDGLDTMGHIFKIYIRIALVAYLPVSVLFTWLVWNDNRKAAKQA